MYDSSVFVFVSECERLYMHAYVHVEVGVYVAAEVALVVVTYLLKKFVAES